MPVFPAIAMQRFDFKNSIIAIKLYIMILNLYLRSEQSPSKSLICGGCALKLNYYNLNSSDEGFWKSDSKQRWAVRLTLPGLHISKLLTVENIN